MQKNEFHLFEFIIQHNYLLCNIIKSIYLFTLFKTDEQLTCYMDDYQQERKNIKAPDETTYTLKRLYLLLLLLLLGIPAPHY